MRVKHQRTLRVVLDGAVTTNQLHATSSVRASSARARLETVNTLTNSATPVTVVNSPGLDDVVRVEHLSVFNRDTVAATITVNRYNGSSDFQVWRGTLQAKWLVTYTPEAGWVVTDDTGTRVDRPRLDAFVGPGATSVDQGSILYRGATAWESLAPDTDGKVLTTHGAAANPTWEAASGGSNVDVQTLTATGAGTWSPGGGVTPTYVRVDMWGAGGGGGGGGSNTGAVIREGGCGGGGGCFKTETYLYSDLGGGSVDYYIGIGGTAGSAGASGGSGGSGGAGENTQWNTGAAVPLIAYGGGGGRLGTSTAAAGGGGGGGGSAGAGATGTAAAGVGGLPATSVLRGIAGCGGQGGVNVTAGDSSEFGGGGGGGRSSSGTQGNGGGSLWGGGGGGTGGSCTTAPAVSSPTPGGLAGVGVGGTGAAGGTSGASPTAGTAGTNGAGRLGGGGGGGGGSTVTANTAGAAGGAGGTRGGGGGGGGSGTNTGGGGAGGAGGRGEIVVTCW